MKDRYSSILGDNTPTGIQFHDTGMCPFKAGDVINVGKVHLKLTAQDVARCSQFMSIWLAVSLDKGYFVDAPGDVTDPLEATVNGELRVYGNSVERIDIPEGILKGRKSWGRVIHKGDINDRKSAQV